VIGSRNGRLAKLTAKSRAEVLIVGGGINGISTLRDLALQGVDAVLVEKNDFSSGASAASSHMVHGGVRYLENGEFRLVKESLQERNRLLKNAPHLVKPLRTTIPIFSLFSGILSAPLRFLTHSPGKPKERGAVLIKIGLILYDTFGRAGGTMPRHQFWGRKKALKNFPDMNPDVKFTASYFDASMESPERLSIEVLKDALQHENANAVNYVSLIGAQGNKVSLRDELSGEELQFEAELVINATGPWTDVTNSLLGESTSYMGGTKGSHIVVDNPELLKACDGREIFFENKDGRIVLMYPLLGRVLIGTTDIKVDINEPVECTEEEIDYFIDLVKLVYPNIEVNRDQIVYKYSGVRPLPAADDLTPGFVSRDYRIELTRPMGNDFGLLSLVGGKWTTFRALGEHLADEAMKLLGAERKLTTAELPIGGGRDFPRDESERSRWLSLHSQDVGEERALQLLNRYGTSAEILIEKISDQGEKFLAGGEYSDIEIQHLIETEAVSSLSDLVYRRTNIGFVGAISDELLEQIVSLAAESLGWDQSEQKRQLKQLTKQGVSA
jgi:glycerol-3-phosphate dehydrogenase